MDNPPQDTRPNPPLTPPANTQSLQGPPGRRRRSEGPSAPAVLAVHVMTPTVGVEKWEWQVTQ